MKKLLYITSIASLFFLAPACNKKLDVQPQNSATPDQIKTSSDVQALLAGAYNQLQSYSAFGEQFMLIPDLLASQDQVDWVGTYANYKQVKTKKIVATNSIASSIWGNSYKLIGICNTVLDKLSIVDTADQATVEGEALFIRGTIYFELVGLFGKPYSDGA
ncbi:MAG: RagB/SusD family nutrient uptake outer membrane protein, partial [Chitinophaga rupis]